MAGSRRHTEAEVWIPYLPRLVLEWAEDVPEQRWCVTDGSLVFVDVSGFTALSERLARRGPIGGEELTDVLGECFTELLSVAYAEGGSLLKFGGDALLLLFDGTGHAGRATAAALAMRATMRRAGRLATSVGNVRLRMSVGVHTGELHLFRVGASHKELIVTGPGATRTVEMEATADAGEIVVSPATAAAIGAERVGAAKGGGFLLRNCTVTSGAATRFPAVPASRAELAMAVPAALRAHLQSGRVESEHRHATVAFVHFDEVDALLERAGADAVADALDELIAAVQAAADDCDVTFLGTDIDRDGGKVILVAGAPRAHDDDEGRMLAALRRITDGEGALPVRIGANWGRVFAGEIGPDYRRTYTVMGDAVNLAARLMAAAAPGQLLATGELLSRARGEYATTALEPFMVKGKVEPVQAYAVGGRRGARAAARASGTPLVGREKSMATLLAALEAARAGQGQVVEIAGDAGMGKSRLLAELRAVTRAPMVVVTAEPYEATTPWFLVRQLLLDALELEPGAPPDLGDALRQRVAAVDAALLAWVPLLADVVGADVAPTAEVSDLDARFRRRRTNQLVVDLLGTLFPGPAVVAFEDVQWADDASAEALRSLAARAANHPWLVITTRREGSDGFRAGDAATVHIELDAVDEEAAAALVRAATADAPLRAHERDALVRRAGGNPLFLEELVRAHAGAGEHDELPDSVEAVVATSIDRLTPDARRLLRYAAVLGVDFDVAFLADIAGEPGDAGLPAASALRRRFRDLVVSDGRGRLRFRNRLVRDVAYETLPFRRRRELHGRAGDAIERAAGDVPESRAEVLSLHFLHAQRYDKCWHYARIGARRASAKYANVEAAELRGRALLAARHLPEVPTDEIAESWERQANAWQRAGAFDKSRASYRRARHFRAGQPVALARIYSQEARIAEAEGRVTAAARWLRRGLRVLERLTGQEEMAQRAHLEARYGWTRQRRGRHRDAVRWGQMALETALAADNLAARAESYVLLDWAYTDLGQPDQAVQTDKALAIWEDLGDLSHQAFALNAMGAFAYYRGEWDEAADLYRRALDAYRRAGNESEAAMARYNTAEILLDQGRIDEAEATLHEVVTVYRAVGYRAGLAMTSRELGRIALRRAEWDDAGVLLDEARETFAAYRAAAKVLEVDAYRAELALRRGHLEDAAALISASLEHATTAGTATLLPMLHRLQGLVLAARGSSADARQALAESLSAARSAGAAYEVAMTLEAKASLAQAEGRAPDAANEHERLHLLHSLGVRSTPRLALPIEAR